jgi:hypothetical protein
MVLLLRAPVKYAVFLEAAYNTSVKLPVPALFKLMPPTKVPVTEVLEAIFVPIVNVPLTPPPNCTMPVVLTPEVVIYKALPVVPLIPSLKDVLA